MGRILLECQSCGACFATGLNMASAHDARLKFKFKAVPYNCTVCGVEREYSSDDLIDEGQSVGNKGRKQPRQDD